MKQISSEVQNEDKPEKAFFFFNSETKAVKKGRYRVEYQTSP